MGFQEGECPICYEHRKGNKCITTSDDAKNDPDYDDDEINGQVITLCTRCFDKARPDGEMSCNVANYMKSLVEWGSTCCGSNCGQTTLCYEDVRICNYCISTHKFEVTDD